MGGMNPKYTEKIGGNNMKRFFIFLTALMCALSIAACGTADSKGGQEDALVYTLLEDGSGYEITACKNTSVKEMTIPAEYKGMPVVSIAGGVFAECRDLASFRTEEGQAVFYAEDGVLFSNRPEKTIVCFPNAYPHFAYQAPADTVAVAPWTFAGQHSVNFIHFQEGFESFGDYAFAGMEWYTDIYVPDSLKTIGVNLLQNQKCNVAFYGKEDNVFCSYARQNNIPYGIKQDRELPVQTVELAVPDLEDAADVLAPDKITKIKGRNRFIKFDNNNMVCCELANLQKKNKNAEIRIDMEGMWPEQTPDADGKTAGGQDAYTGLYGLGFTQEETVLRGYDRDGNVTGVRKVNGDFLFWLPGADTIGVSGGTETTLRILPQEPVCVSSVGKLPLDPEGFHWNEEDSKVQYYIVPFPYTSISFDFPFDLNIFCSMQMDVLGKEPKTSPHYAILIIYLDDPYLMDQANKIAIDFDHLDLLFENEELTCLSATRFGLDEEFGKDVNAVRESVKNVMSGVYYPADEKINHMTVEVTGEYPTSFDSTITLDEACMNVKEEILTYAHEMTHAVDQSLGIDLPSAWLEGRAEYISRKVCDVMGVDVWKYEDSFDWSFLSGEDRADFFRYYMESTNRETNYSVGYYFFKYLCDTYGEDVSAKIMQNIQEAAGRLGDEEWSISADTFKKCVTDATDHDVFQNFVRDVME